ncbi:MAG: phosphotransferase [Phormidesmis sp.]
MSSLNLCHLQENLSAHLRRHCPTIQCRGLSLLAHGEANVIFRLNDRQLVRVAVNTPNQRFGGDFSQLTRFEQAVLRYIKGSGLGHELQAAQIQPPSDFPYTYLITNYIGGEPLDYSRPHLQRCAQTLARLHRLPRVAGYEVAQLVPPIPVVDQPLTLFYQEAKDYAQPYLEAANADPEIVEMIQALLAKAKARLPAEQRLIEYPYRCLVHSDHTYENWVIDDHQAYLIDWEWAEIGSPAGDLGHFLSPVTVCRRQGYQLLAADRAFFLRCYYDALEDEALASKLKHHFAAFGPFPAVRSLCWTVGYWMTARRWYAEATAESASAAERIRRLQASRDQFAQLWQSVMAWLDEEV